MIDLYLYNNKAMKCTDCKEGEPKPGTVTVSYDKNDTTIVIKDVPALVCPVCGAYYLDLDTTDKIAKIVNAAVKNGAVVEIVRMKAA
jgi:YgiT-type zinc finger domain-containing protein